MWSANLEASKNNPTYSPPDLKCPEALFPVGSATQWGDGEKVGRKEKQAFWVVISGMKKIFRNGAPTLILRH